MSFTTPDGQTYRVADAHTHIYKDKIAKKASQTIGEYYVTEMAEYEATSEKLIEHGQTIGCERYLVCSAATTVTQVPSINKFIAGECSKHPEFVGLGTAHQDVEDPEALCEEILNLGLRGIKLHPDFQKFNIDDPCMLPLYRSAAQAGLIMLFHVGDERVDFSDPARLARVLEKVPDLKCQAAHFGCCRTWKRRPLPLAGSDVMYDTSSMSKWASAEDMAELIDILSIDRMMFGTDFPMWEDVNERDRMLAIGLSPEDNRKLFYDNFARFYGVED